MIRRELPSLFKPTIPTADAHARMYINLAMNGCTSFIFGSAADVHVLLCREIYALCLESYPWAC